MSTHPIAADHIRDLTRPFTTTVVITQPVQGPDQRWRTLTTKHTVTHPALIAQIENTVTSSANAGNTGRTPYGPKPAGRIDCLAFLERVNTQSTAMADAHLLPPQPLTVRLRTLSGLIGNHPNAKVRAWWTTARILTQHDGPPYSPDVPCPNEACDHRGSLRVRVDDRIGVCVECQDTWSDDEDDPARTFGRLAVWVRWASEHLHGPRHLVVVGGVTEECPECAPERAAAATRARSRVSAALRGSQRLSEARTGRCGIDIPRPGPQNGAHRPATPKT